MRPDPGAGTGQGRRHRPARQVGRALYDLSSALDAAEPSHGRPPGYRTAAGVHGNDRTMSSVSPYRITKSVRHGGAASRAAVVAPLSTRGEVTVPPRPRPRQLLVEP